VVPDLHRYDWVIVNSSAGKDSQASLSKVIKTAKAQNYPLDRIVVAHADLGEMEWPGTLDLAKEHAAHYGLRFEVERRPQGDLLQQVEERGMWPDSKNRFCTSDHKRGQIARLFTKLTKETRDALATAGSGVRDQPRPVRDRVRADRHPRHVGFDEADVDWGGHRGRGGRVLRVRPARPAKRSLKKVRFLSVFGFRSEESPARKKMVEFEIDERLTNTLRHVDRWLPVHHWSTRDVWHEIHQSGMRSHWAYQRGMSRLSCRFCIFAPKSQLMISAQQPENREVFERYVQLEIKIGHRFKAKESLQDIKAAVEAGEQVAPGSDDGCWNM